MLFNSIHFGKLNLLTPHDKMKHYLYITLISILLSKHYGMTHVIRKRQLFREQVLPHAGGKIPEFAFHTDRLALNRLQKDGIAVPDGVLLEQRRYQVFPHQHRTFRPTILVAQSSDGRYTSPEGFSGHNGLETVDSTYIVPMPWETGSYHKHSPALIAGYVHSKPVVPVFKELRVPNYSVFNFDYSNFKNKLVKKPVSLLTTGAISSAYSPASISHHTPKPSLTLEPQSYVGYHAALGNLLSYQPAYAYGNDWDKGWEPTSAYHINHDLSSSHPLNSFEDFYADPGGKQRYYRHAGQSSSSAAEKIRSTRTISSQQPLAASKGRRPSSASSSASSSPSSSSLPSSRTTT